MITIYVDGNEGKDPKPLKEVVMDRLTGVKEHDGLSPASAFKTIAEAMEHALEGENTIMVIEGKGIPSQALTNRFKGTVTGISRLVDK